MTPLYYTYNYVPHLTSCYYPKYYKTDLFRKSVSSDSDDIKKYFNKNTLVSIMTKPISEKNKEHKETFYFFLDYFGKPIAEASKYNDNKKKLVMFQDSCTTSDEAFGVFTLERCWDTWMKEMLHGKEKVKQRESNYVEKNSNKKFAGWKSSGLKRYSTIAEAVTTSRISDARRSIEEAYRIQKNSTGDTYFDGQDEISSFKPSQITYVPYNDLPQSIMENDKNTDTEDNRNHTISPIIQNDTYVESPTQVMNPKDLIHDFENNEKTTKVHQRMASFRSDDESMAHSRSDNEESSEDESGESDEASNDDEETSDDESHLEHRENEAHAHSPKQTIMITSTDSPPSDHQFNSPYMINSFMPNQYKNHAV